MSRLSVLATGKINRPNEFEKGIELEDRIKSLERQLVVAKAFIKTVGCEHWYKDSQKALKKMELVK